MATKMADRELLEAIFSTLHGLEMCLHEQENRRISEDSVTPSGGGSSLTRHGSVSSTNTNNCSCGGHKQEISQMPQSPPSWGSQPAMAYMTSLAEIRKRFHFDSASDILTEPRPPFHDGSTAQRREEDHEGVIDYSSSVYPSRPLSRLDLLVNPHKGPEPQESVPKAMQFSDPPPAIRYEDTPVDEYFDLHKSTNSARSSSSTASSAEPSANSHQSPSRLSSAGTYFGPPIRRASAIVRSVSSPRRSKGKQTETRLSQETSETADDESPVTKKTRMVTQFSQVVQKTVTLCLCPLKKLVAGVSRAMMNQQLRMLEVSR